MYFAHTARTSAGAFVGAIQRGNVIEMAVVVVKLMHWHVPPPELYPAYHCTYHSVEASRSGVSFHGRVCRSDSWMWRIEEPVIA